MSDGVKTILSIIAIGCILAFLQHGCSEQHSRDIKRNLVKQQFLEKCRKQNKSEDLCHAEFYASEL